MTSVVAHIALVGFHHKNGPQAEYIYPPLSDKPHEPLQPIALPLQWNHMPFLALPDGIHKRDRDYSFFHLPSLKDPTKTLYCVSCAQSISVSELKAKEKDVTRNTVLKGIVVFSNMPLYAMIKEQISAATHVLFSEKDFTSPKVWEDLIEHLYLSLTRSLSLPSALDDDYLHEGLNARFLVLHYRQKLLQLFKLLLLEKKVMIHNSADDACNFICQTAVSLASLMPSLLRKGFSLPLEDPDSGITAADVEAQKKAAQAAAGASGTSAPAPDGTVWSEPTASPTFGEELPMQERLDRAGLPLQIFGEHCAFFPYATLQNLGQLETVQGCLVGTTNMLMVTTKKYADVLIDAGPKATVDFRDSKLKAMLSLTTADLRFMEYLIKTCEDAGTPGAPADQEVSAWEGSSGWVRQQFGEYLLALLSTADQARNIPSDPNLEALSDFGAKFAEAWKFTTNYYNWTLFVDAELQAGRRRTSHVESVGHPFRGGIKVSDISRRAKHLGEAALGTERTEKIRSAVNESSKAVGSVLSSVKSGISNMLKSDQLAPQSFFPTTFVKREESEDELTEDED